MGQTTAPLAVESQQLNRSVVGTANKFGVATFTLDAPAIGTTWTGTLSCPGAPTSAAFVASVALQQWCQWAGEATAGPVQLFANQQLVVTGSGLIPNASYDLVMIGTSDPAASRNGALGPAPVWPDPTASSAITLAGGIPLGQDSNQTSGLGPILAVPLGVRTLVLEITASVPPQTISLVTVTAQSPAGPMNFYSNIPYLTNGSGTYWVIVPIPVPVSSVGIVATTSGGGAWSYIATGDTQLYDESIYYNGQTQITSFAGAVGTTTLANGPLRLLTAWADVQGGVAGDVVIQTNIANSNIVRVSNTAISGGQTSIVALPQPFIIPTGQLVRITVATNGQGGISWAYP